jgi:hypothetical protein
VGFLEVFVLATVNVSAIFINNCHSFVIWYLLFRPISATIRAQSWDFYGHVEDFNTSVKVPCHSPFEACNSTTQYIQTEFLSHIKHTVSPSKILTG